MFKKRQIQMKKDKLAYENRKFPDEKIAELEKNLRNSVLASLAGGVFCLAAILLREQIQPLFVFFLALFCLSLLALAFYFLRKFKKIFYNNWVQKEPSSHLPRRRK